MIKLSDVKKGSFVDVRTTSGEIHHGVVDEVERDVKNGCPGIDYTIVKTGEQYWAYLDQVVSVTKF